MNSNLQQQPGPKQPEDGDDKELNLTHSEASLADKPEKAPDGVSMSDNAATAASDNLMQSVINASEINPEYGDAADPTFEKL